MDAPTAQDLAPKKGINPILLTGVVVLLVFVAGLAYVFFSKGSINSFLSFTRPKATPKATTPSTNASVSGKSANLPVSLDNPAILSTHVVYNFNTTVKELKNSSKDLILTTPINGLKDDGIPEVFRITSNTRIYFLQNKKTTPATSSDLAVGQKVHVMPSYNLKTKKWTTARVDIVLLQASASATPQSSVEPQ